MLISTLGREQHPIPHEEGETITFRPLSGPEMEDCTSATTKRVLGNLGDQVEVIGKLNVTRNKEDEPSEFDKAKQRIDARTALPLAIVGWSYVWPEPTDDELVIDGNSMPGEPVPVNAENILKLDERTWNWALEKIVEMNTIFPQTGSDS